MLTKHLSQQAYDFASDTFNIEHVLPQNAPDNWGGGIGNDDTEALLFRLAHVCRYEKSFSIYQ
ncbi:MAG: hypothetical protein HKM02_09135 [Pseudomonadales bacterium]|nr:hypothetical protein [Pseudomonadales bacterium]